jgi:hypothetical protein
VANVALHRIAAAADRFVQGRRPSLLHAGKPMVFHGAMHRWWIIGTMR